MADGSEDAAPLAAVVLAGGASRRMGREKALLTLPDGRTALEVVLTAARAVAHPVLLAVDTAEHSEQLRRALPEPMPPLLLDSSPGAGPLAALADAMEAVDTPAILALSCDMPLVRRALLHALHLALYDEAGSRQSMALPVVDGVAQPFPACYATALAGHARQLLRAERRGPRALQDVPGLLIRHLDEAALRAVDPDLRSFATANTPEEWERLLARVTIEAP